MGKSAAGSRSKKTSVRELQPELAGLRFAAKGTKKAAGISGRWLSRELLALLGFQFRKPFEDERVGLIGQLGDERKIIATVAVGVVVVPGFVHVGSSEVHVEKLFLVGFVLPHSGFDSAEAESFHRKLRAGGGVRGWRGGLSVFGGHIVPFLILRSGIALSPKGGGAGWDEGTLGGIPFKEDPNAPCPRSGGPAGGAARESNNDPGKKNVPLWRNCLEER